MPNYLAPTDPAQQQAINDSVARGVGGGGIKGPKVLGDCQGLEQGLAAPFRDVANRAKLPSPGSKPLALHTEFAQGQANWEAPYAPNTEVVFYLMRADKGAGNMTKQVGAFTGKETQRQALYGNNFSAGDPAALSMQAGEQQPPSATFGSNVQAGPAENIPNVETQTPVNQVAVKETVSKLDAGDFGTAVQAGPMTGLDITQAAPVGSNTQFGAETMGPVAAASNLTKYKYSPKERTESIPASQILFSEILQKSFNPDFDPASAERIRGTLARGTISSLAQRLAMATNGVTNSRDFIEAINNGRLGMGTPMATLQARRLGPETLLETTTTPPARPYSGATTYGAA